MKNTLRFVGICGSLRSQSRNMGLLRYAQSISAVPIEIADISQIPFYNADVQAKPAAVLKLIEQVKAADALVLACPEYNYSLAPALKNALDWLSREPNNLPLDGKAVAIMGAGGGMGTSRSQYHLRQVCVFLNLRPLNKPEVFSNAFTESFTEAGELVDSALQQLIATQMSALEQSCRTLSQVEGI